MQALSKRLQVPCKAAAIHRPHDKVSVSRSTANEPPNTPDTITNKGHLTETL